MKKISIALFSALLLLSSTANAFKPKRAYYQITVYHIANATQMAAVDNYLQGALIPALHRAGIAKVGVFKPIANDTAADKKIFVFIPFKTIDQIDKTDVAIWKDEQHLKDGAAYIDAPYNQTPFVRKEAILLKAYEQMPDFAAPKITGTADERVYELRSYEGPTEKMYRKKVEMFNAGGEVALFVRLNFNAIFYGEVLAGARMPNLMYMTSFNNMDDRNAHWKTFSADPEWKTLSGKAEYKNTVQRNETILCHATEYSEL
ncbi:MAG: NIPSNAP family containing protein [Bacteroidetes bacterium 24-39-8]|jgi:hypothetical protein|nr:MAG: NIPSNAP family containing protein [Bacteroidetes bacterium 24-39-8]HQS53848.1 NIPSNAP family protein [Sediminibacterium sp.]